MRRPSEWPAAVARYESGPDELERNRTRGDRIMFYTVVKKSGWHTDKNWCIVKTFTSKAKANEFASNNKASDPRSDWYNTAVIAHRKPVSEYAHDDAYRIGGKTYIR